MITEEFLTLLRCPQSLAPLTRGGSDLVRGLNQAIAQGKVRNRAGALLTRPLDGLLIREDGRLGYPIIDDIPILLVDEALALDDSGQHETNGIRT
jgi:uncharacterized protein YbaR (Trm112 family)